MVDVSYNWPFIVCLILISVPFSVSDGKLLLNAEKNLKQCKSIGSFSLKHQMPLLVSVFLKGNVRLRI